MPMMTSTAQNIRWIGHEGDGELAVLGLVATGCGRCRAPGSGRRCPMPGMVTPATIGWNIVSSSCRPRKYHGAFDGFGVWLMLASVEQRGVDEDREDEQEGGA